MKCYSAVTDEVLRALERMRAMYHPELDQAQVTVGALFVFDDEASSENVLTHNGYPAGAMVRITSLRDRALGMPDAVMIIDRAYWLMLRGPQCDALVDHELQHLELVVDEDTNLPLGDAIGRPRLSIRKHDRQMGWFDEVARRHGEASPEVRQARSLIAETGQLYLQLDDPKVQAAVLAERVSRAAGAHTH